MVAILVKVSKLIIFQSNGLKLYFCTDGERELFIKLDVKGSIEQTESY